MIPCGGRRSEGVSYDHGRVCEVDTVGTDEGAEGELGVAHHGSADVRKIGGFEGHSHGLAAYVICASGALATFLQ